VQQHSALLASDLKNMCYSDRLHFISSTLLVTQQSL
jgi:hypothetical protein